MKSEFWQERWQENQIGWHEEDGNAALKEYIDSLNLAEGARVFIPLCGKTHDIAWLLKKGYRVVGAELSEIAIQQLFDELGVTPEIHELPALKQYRAPNLDIFVGDIFDLTESELGVVDAIYDRAAFVALPHEMRVRYTAHLRKISDNSPQLLLTLSYDQSLAEAPPFAISDEEVLEHYDDHYKISKLSTHDIPGGIRGEIPGLETVWHLA